MLQVIQAESKHNPFVAKMTEARLDLAVLSTDEGWRQYLEQLQQEATAQQLSRTGRVPSSTYWLIGQLADGEELVLGRLNIRHFLTPKLRRSFGHLGYIIHPQYRRRGLGEQLLQLARPLAAQLVTDLQQHRGRLLLACRAGNQASLQLLHKLGAEFEQEVSLPTGGRELLYWLTVN